MLASASLSCEVKVRALFNGTNRMTQASGSCMDEQRKMDFKLDELMHNSKSTLYHWGKTSADQEFELYVDYEINGRVKGAQLRLAKKPRSSDLKSYPMSCEDLESQRRTSH